MTGASAFPDRLKSVDLDGGTLDAGRLPVLYVVGNRAGLEVGARKLLAAGAVVVHASDPEPVPALEWGDWMRPCIRQLTEADGVALLPGSGGLRSAGILCGLAHDLAMPVRTVPAWLTHLGQMDYMGRLLAGRKAGP